MAEIKVPAPVAEFFGRFGTVLTSKTSLVGAGGLFATAHADSLGLPPKYVLIAVVAKMLQQGMKDFGANAKPKA